MAKIKSSYVCQDCGYMSPKWMGKCPGCSSFNSMVEEIEKDQPIQKLKAYDSKPLMLNEIEIIHEERFSCGIEEFDRVLGGGIVKGSLILVGGDPGIGKSTLLLQISKNLSDKQKSVIYISGEESARQIKLRAERVEAQSGNLYILTETDLSVIERHIIDYKPDVVIVDSIQTMCRMELQSSPGSVSQVREATSTFMRISKTSNTAIFIVGHVTKEGAIAGPRVLEHMVDTVLYFEGERHQSYRIIRAVKNRFGSTNEIGVFEMRGSGLVEVTNPSEMMISGRPEDVSGSTVICNLEGTRPLLVEVQALTASTGFGMPRRMATGIDYNRIIMLVAVLEKRVGLQLQTYDIYVNIVGGIKAYEPAVDLGILGAIVSSFRNIPINSKTVLMGEVGLAGEVRGISGIEKRVIESQKLGFERCILPKQNLKEVKNLPGIKIVPVSNIYDALEEVLGG